MEEMILHSGRNLIRLVEREGKMVVEKRFHRPNLVQKIVYTFFQPTKAYRAFHHGEELIKRGFDTPRPISYLETRKCGFIDYCYYTCEKTSLPPIEELTDRDDWNKDLAHDFAHFVARLHEHGVLHHDLNDTNTLYLKEDDGYSFSVIDINRMTFFPMGKEIPLKICLDNLTRFTGRMDLFEFVVREYAKARQLDEESTTLLGIKIKAAHDRNWYRRKRFTGFLKSLFLKH